jgi:hypothetical protein
MVCQFYGSPHLWICQYFQTFFSCRGLDCESRNVLMIYPIKRTFEIWLMWLTRVDECVVVGVNSNDENFNELVYALVENPPFCNYCSTTNQVENYTCSCNFFLQLLTSNVEKYKSKVKLQLKVYATCQHHNNSHYVPLLANLVENCSTNIVEGCCQLHSTNGWTSSTD